jgi:hypothetical protein
MGVVQDFLAYVRPSRNRNGVARINDATDAISKVRSSGYGDLSVQNLNNSHHSLSEEGSYFVTSNPTPGTGILVPMVAALTDTSPALVIQNTDLGSATSLRAFIDYIKLTLFTVGGGTPTDFQFAIFLDNIPRLGGSPGGSNLTPVNVNMDAPNNLMKSILNVYFGAVTALAKSNNARLIAQGNLRSIAPVVKDVYQFNFGAVEKAIANSFAIATAGHIHHNIAPGTIGGQQTLLMYLWSSGETTTGKNFTFEMGSWER